MKKIFLYGHGGSGNHGCEAIVRSTVQIIRQITEIPIFLISSNLEEDENYGVNKLCSLIREKNTFSKWSLEFLSAYLNLKFRKEYIPMDKLEYEKAFNYVEEGDLAFAIGGDNYCYKDVERHIMMHEMMLERGAKTILWGCSIEPDILKNPIIEKDISKYQFITARESVSYRALKSVNKHTFFIHDPAFSLKMARSDVCDSIKKGMTVGINISPMIIENENIPGIVMKNYQKLIEYILKKSEMEIILIPHVVWKNGDDRIPIRKLYEKYENNNRVNLTLNEVDRQWHKKRGFTVLRTIFPPVKSMKREFSFLKTAPFLLPIAWILRILKYGKEVCGYKCKDVAGTLETGNRRIRLMKKYKIIK